MKLLDFNKRFPTEHSARLYLIQKREEEGIICKKCGNSEHIWLDNQSYWRCKTCRSCTQLTAGTVMEKSHIPIDSWFKVIHLMTATKQSLSALEMQRQIGMKRYEPVWYMMQKIRSAMGKRDSQYTLKGTIEVDDAFFEIVNLPEKDELGNVKTSIKVVSKGDDEQKRGRGSNKQMKVMVMVESTYNPNQTNPHKKNRAMGFAKMVVMDNLNSIGINYEIEKSIDKNATVLTDGYHSFRKIDNVISNHVKMVVPSKEAHKKLPWVHTVISNAKSMFLGTHHSIGKDYLQNYLNEYCYKLNRRSFNDDLFDRMILAGVQDTWY